MSTPPAELRCLELATEQGGIVRKIDALALGVSERAIQRLVASGRWRQPFPGVVSPAGAEPTYDLWLRAAILAGGDGTTGSHRSAARVLGFDGFEAETTVEITSPRRIRWPGVIAHRSDLQFQHDTTRVEGLRVTTATRTLIDLPSVVRPERLEAALDSALVKGLTSTTYLERKLDEAGTKGRRGAAVLKGLLESRRASQGPTESELERMFTRNVVRRHRLRMPVSQFPLMDNQGEMRIDFAYPDLLLAIEVLGWQFHLGRRRWERDLARHNRLAAQGWMILYFAWSDVVHRPDFVADKVQAVLNEGGTLALDK